MGFMDVIISEISVTFLTPIHLLIVSITAICSLCQHMSICLSLLGEDGEF